MDLHWERVNSTVRAILLLIAFIYATTICCVIVPWLSISVPGVTNALILTWTTGGAVAHLLACVLLDPGAVPSTWTPDLEVSKTVIEVKRKGGTSRYCHKCQQHKPPRCHHCRVCRRCILRMDHHCHWLNACIGHNNYKAFISFLLYVTAAAVQALGLLVAHALHLLTLTAEHRAVRTGPRGQVLGGSGTASAAAWAAMQTICTVLTLPLAVALCMLTGWNIYLASGNRTSIEYHEGVQARVLTLRAGQPHRHVYNLGLLDNLTEILGPNPLAFGAAAAGDGLDYPTGWD